LATGLYRLSVHYPMNLGIPNKGAWIRFRKDQSYSRHLPSKDEGKVPTVEGPDPIPSLSVRRSSPNIPTRRYEEFLIEDQRSEAAL